MARGSTLARFFAVVTMIATGGDADKALPMFVACTKGEEVAEGKDFLGRWWQRYEQRQPGEDFLQDRLRSGRPKKMDDTTTQECARQFKKTTPVHGKRRHYRDAHEVGSGLAAGARLANSTL